MKSKFWGRAFVGWFHNLYRTLIRHPQHRWWVIAGTMLYLLGPIDIAPDVIPFVGWIDDGLVATLLVTELSQLMVAGLKSRRQTSPTSVESSQATAVIDVNAISVH
jgi:uncharacterized membrane protein YkvA (DUF1232 family)